jgi:hypothetical protein
MLVFAVAVYLVTDPCECFCFSVEGKLTNPSLQPIAPTKDEWIIKKGAKNLIFRF